MAKKSKIAAEVRRRRLVARYAGRRAEIKAAIAAGEPGSVEQMAAIRALSRLPRDSSPVRLRNRDSVDTPGWRATSAARAPERGRTSFCSPCHAPTACTFCPSTEDCCCTTARVSSGSALHGSTGLGAAWNSSVTGWV